MKTMFVFGFALLGVVYSASSEASVKVIDVTYHLLAEVDPVKGIEHSEVQAYDRGLFVSEQIVRGELTVSEFDDETFGTKITKIPTMLVINQYGLLAKFRYLPVDDVSFNISNYEGKAIHSLFGTYRGIGKSISAVVNLGEKLLFNGKGNYIHLVEALGLGIGINLSYVSFKLTPVERKATIYEQVVTNKTGASETRYISKKEALGRILN